MEIIIELKQDWDCKLNFLAYFENLMGLVGKLDPSPWYFSIEDDGQEGHNISLRQG